MELNTKLLVIFVTVCSMTLLQPLLTQAKAAVTDKPTESYDKDTTDTVENLNATTAPTNASDHEEGYSSGLCRRVPRMVNFHDDLHYSFIAKPVEFDLGDCVGDCPVLSSDSTAYSLFKRHLDGEYHLSCCVPTAFEPLQVLVNVYNPVTQRNEKRLDRIKDASVKSCGCC